MSPTNPEDSHQIDLSNLPRKPPRAYPQQDAPEQVYGGRPCQWTEDEDEHWRADCGTPHAFECYGETPTAHEWRFCPYCGRKLVEKRYEEPTT